VNTFGASIANHQSGLPPGHLSMPGKQGGFVVTPDERVPVTGATVLRWEYAWMRPVSGWKAAKWVDRALPQLKVFLVSCWTKPSIG
jgi:hypothetical protein